MATRVPRHGKLDLTLAAIIGLVAVLVVALLRPTGPVTIRARDITVHQEATIK